MLTVLYETFVNVWRKMAKVMKGIQTDFKFPGPNPFDLDNSDMKPEFAVELAGALFVGEFSCRANYCLGSVRLLNICRSLGVRVYPMNRRIIAGATPEMEGPKFRAIIPVVLYGKRVHVTFILFSSNFSKVVLGVNYLSKANVVFQPHRQCWFFTDNPFQRVPYHDNYTESVLELLETRRSEPFQETLDYFNGVDSFFEMNDYGHYKVNEVKWSEIVQNLCYDINNEEMQLVRPSTSSDYSTSRPINRYDVDVVIPKQGKRKIDDMLDMDQSD